MSTIAVTHQVVSRSLLGAVEVVDRDTEDIGAHHAVGAAGQAHPVQCPVQHAGPEAELRAQCARGCKTGAYTQDRILGGYHCHVWVVDKQTPFVIIYLPRGSVPFVDVRSRFLPTIRKLCLSEEEERG